MPQLEVSQRSRSSALTRERASAFARLALKGMGKEYPNKPEHVVARPADVKGPKALHPAFYGSTTGTRPSMVTGCWRGCSASSPTCPRRATSGPCSGTHLTAENIKVEADYFARKESKPFERPYGWAWLLKLAEELHRLGRPGREVMGKQPPAARRRGRDSISWNSSRSRPTRSGPACIPNTAFGLSFAHDYARVVRRHAAAATGRRAGAGLLPRGRRRAGRLGAGRGRFLLAKPDRGRPDETGARPGRVPVLVRRFLPGAAKGEPKSLFTPATVTDRTDPQLVHLDGLNLSRAWCMRSVAAALPADDTARASSTSADRHAQSALEHVASGDYAGEHWLASFAVYLLSSQSGD